MRTPYVSLRWKVSVAFTLVVSLVFVGAYVLVHNTLTNAVGDRIEADLLRSAQAGAAALDPAMTTELAAAVEDGAELSSTTVGYLEDELGRLADISGLTRTYVYTRDPDGVLIRLAGVDDTGEPDPAREAGEPVHEPTEEMERGLREVVLETRGAASAATWGRSAYVPLATDTGAPPAALHVYFSLDYLRSERDEHLSRLSAASAAVYVVLLLAVLVLATRLTSRVRRIARIASEMGEGADAMDASPEQLAAVGSMRLPDEMATLSSTLADMARRVAAREKKLVAEVRRLTISIDEKRKREDVARITADPGFDDIVSKAAAMRARHQGNPEQHDGGR